MKRRWQIFVAPGPESQPLPTPQSPWHDERWVNIPLEYWELLLRHAELRDGCGNMMSRLSLASADDETHHIQVTTEELKTMLPFIVALVASIAKSEDLVPEPSDELPDCFSNAELTRKLLAFDAVLRESIRLEEPFRAWRE